MYASPALAAESFLTLFFSSGNARVTAFASTGTARTYNYQVRVVSCSLWWILISFQGGDIGYFPASYGEFCLFSL